MMQKEKSKQQSCGWKYFVMEVRGEWTDWFELAGRLIHHSK